MKKYIIPDSVYEYIKDTRKIVDLEKQAQKFVKDILEFQWEPFDFTSKEVSNDNKTLLNFLDNYPAHLYVSRFDDNFKRVNVYEYAIKVWNFTVADIMLEVKNINKLWNTQ